MRGLQVIEVEVYPFENKHDRRRIVAQNKFKKNEVTIHEKMVIVTHERIEYDVSC